MGRTGASLGLAVALAVGAYAGWAFWDDPRAWPYAAFLMTGALALFLGASCTLLKVRGGMRLLAGALGVMVGVASQNALTQLFDAAPPPSLRDLISDVNADHLLLTQSWLVFSVGPLFLLSLAGLAFVVMHRE